MSYQTCLQEFPPLSEAKGFFLPPSSPDPLELCEEHAESLSMFCLDDLEPLCEQCAAESHAGHRVYLLTEAAIDCKEELRTSLKGLNVKMIDCGKVLQTYQHLSRYNQAEAKLAEEFVKREFKTLHQFLRQEEAARLQALKEEQDEKMRGAEERRDQINQVIKSLEEKIQLAEEVIDAGGDGVKFLQDYRDTLNSSWIADRKPQKMHRPLINVAKHLGNLRYAVWEKMKHVAPFIPVTLDSRTAGPSLEVSSGLSGVHIAPGSLQTRGEVMTAPANPERFHPYSCILGSEGFSSGVHSWTVEVSDTDDWTLGVAAQWVYRKIEFEECPDAGLWCISLRDGEYQALTTPPKILHIKNSEHLHRVCMRFSWNSGTLTFMNADTHTHLYTFTHRFSEVVYPYFESITPGGGLALMANRVDIIVELDCQPGENPLIITEKDLIERESNPVIDFDPSLNDNNSKTVNGHPTKDKKSHNCSVKEVKTMKPEQKNKKASNSKTASKKQTSRSRFNVTYHVSLNRALNDMSKQHGDHKNADK